MPFGTSDRVLAAVTLMLVGAVVVLRSSKGGVKEAAVPFDWALPPPPSAKCLTPRPADPSVPFPCASRVKRFNSENFYEGWHDDAVRNEIFRRIERFCRPSTAIEKVEESRPTVGIRIVGAIGESGRWNRFWLVPIDEGGLPSCHRAVLTEVQMESTDAKVGVDRVLYPADGILEVQAYVRVPGMYRVCVYMSFVMEDGDLLPLGAPTEMGAIYTAYNFSRKRREGIPDTPYSRDSAYDVPSVCIIGDFTGGVRVQPLPVPCWKSDDMDRFRFGGWVRLPRCDGVFCSGPMNVVSGDGWVWVSDVCVVRLFSRHEMWRLVDRQWLLAWGVSTMKQPMSNFMEYALQRPIFSVFMERIASYKGPRNRQPTFFTYRDWDVVARNGTQEVRMTMKWGGCFSVISRPDHCIKTMGYDTWPKLLPYLAPQGPLRRREDAQKVAKYPSMFFIDHDVWHFPKEAEVIRIDQLKAAMQRVEDWRVNVANAEEGWEKPPIVVLHTHPAPQNTSTVVQKALFNVPLALNILRHSAWIHEDFYAAHVAEQWRRYATMAKAPAKKRPLRWVLLSREALTMALRFGDEYVHIGVHYGATRGMCSTGSTKNYELRRCLRNVMGDNMLMMWWMNLLLWDNPLALRQ